jgi:hypothetical protein
MNPTIYTEGYALGYVHGLKAHPLDDGEPGPGAPAWRKGYRLCACRDCMEIAIGQRGAMCHACATAECEGGETECACIPEDT